MKRITLKRYSRNQDGRVCRGFGSFFGEDVFFQAEDGIRDAQESRGLGDVYKRQRYPSSSGRVGLSSP